MTKPEGRTPPSPHNSQLTTHNSDVARPLSVRPAPAPQPSLSPTVPPSPHNSQLKTHNSDVARPLSVRPAPAPRCSPAPTAPPSPHNSQLITQNSHPASPHNSQLTTHNSAPPSPHNSQLTTHNPKVRDECGVIGVYAPDAGPLVVLGLQALQHRGQESAGAATFDGTFHMHKGMGLVEKVFTNHPDLPGSWAIGHNRYSTCGSSVEDNAGPFVADTDLGPVVLAHNGNIVNADQLKSFLSSHHGLAPASTSDSELLALLLRAAPGHSWSERIQWMASCARGSYSLVLLTRERLYGVRDPMGNRPLALGRLPEGWALASESCAFSLIGGRPVRDIHPGEIVEIDIEGPKPAGQLMPTTHAFCAFEYIYIARPDTIIAGRPVHSARRSIGEELGREHSVDADLVIGVPDSGTSAALGYSTTTGIPFGEGLIKNRYVGRTFINPAQGERERLIRMKFGALPMHGRRVVLVDDSIVRGNTLRPIVSLLRDADASEIHVRIAAPPIKEPCFLGVDMASQDELIANALDEEAMAERVGADSLRYVSVDGLLRAIRGSRDNHCLACFTGEYPESVASYVAARNLQEVAV